MTRIYYSSSSHIEAFILNLRLSTFDDLVVSLRDIKFRIEMIKEEAFDIGAAYAGMDTTKIPPNGKARLLDQKFNSRLSFKPEDTCPNIYLFINTASGRIFSVGSGTLSDAILKFSLGVQQVPNFTDSLPADYTDIRTQGEDIYFGDFKILTIRSQKFISL